MTNSFIKHSYNGKCDKCSITDIVYEVHTGKKGRYISLCLNCLKELKTDISIIDRNRCIKDLSSLEKIGCIT